MSQRVDNTLIILTNPPYTLHEMDDFGRELSWNSRMLWWFKLLCTEEYQQSTYQKCLDDKEFYEKFENEFLKACTTWFSIDDLTNFLKWNLKHSYDYYLELMEDRDFYIVSENKRVTFRGITTNGILLIETYLKPKTLTNEN